MTEVTSQTSILSAQADVATADAGVAWAERDLVAAQGRLREAEANYAKAQDDVARYKALVDKDEIPRQIYDQAVSNAKAQQADVDANRADTEASQKLEDQRRSQLVQAQSHLAEANRNAPQRLAVSRANVVAKQADAQVAKTRVEQAELNLTYTKIYAPVSGVITKRSVEVGNRVQPGQQLFLIGQLDDLWVTANFKETQLYDLRVGQPVDIEIDAFGRTFPGHVDSVQAGSGTAFSLLPAENATGNYVKVVQRIPVKIVFNRPPDIELGPGMSVLPTVRVKPPCGLCQLLERL